MLKRTKINHKPRKKKGQSTVEYIILITAVLAVLIVFLRPGGVFSGAVNKIHDENVNALINMSGRLKVSR